jgi:hypothetical protein
MKSLFSRLSELRAADKLRRWLKVKLRPGEEENQILITELLNQASADDKNALQHKSTPSLWNLPAEIWLQILRYLLIKRPEQPDGDTLVIIPPLSGWCALTNNQRSNNQLSSQVLRTNRANHATGVEILYGENVFEMNGDDVRVFPNFLNDIGRSNVSRLRHLRLDHRNAGYAYRRGAPRYSREGVMHVDTWGRDGWLDRLFENFSSLRSLETLSIAVDLHSWKFGAVEAIDDMNPYLGESGLSPQLLAACRRGDGAACLHVYGQVTLYMYKLGISRAVTSLEDARFPELSAHVYYGEGPNGAYGIFSTKELDSLTPAKKQTTAAQLLVVSFQGAKNVTGCC